MSHQASAAADPSGAAATAQPVTVKTTVYVTGYGPFADIKANPSTTVGKRVAEGLERRRDLAGVHFTELETSIAAASAYFDELEKSLEEALTADPSQRFLLFHIGVHSRERAGVMRVETVGYNELDASVPDVRGVVFNHDVIDAADGDTATAFTTFFSQGEAAQERLRGIVESLNESNAKRVKEKGLQSTAFAASSPKHVGGARTAAAALDAGADTQLTAMEMPVFQIPHWVISTDAGRYLCNYCLYRSLKVQQKFMQQYGHQSTVKAPPVSSVFIHVCDPKQGTDGGEEGKIAEYNPSIMDQCRQTELLAHELTDWVMEA